MTVVPALDLISSRQYYLIICMLLSGGAWINYLLCRTVGSLSEYINPWLLFLLYIAAVVFGFRLSLNEREPVSVLSGYALVIVPAGIVASTIVDAASRNLGAEFVADIFLIVILSLVPVTLLALVKPDWCGKGWVLILSAAIGVALGILVLIVLGYGGNGYVWIPGIILCAVAFYELYAAQRMAYSIDNAIDGSADIYMDILTMI